MCVCVRRGDFTIPYFPPPHTADAGAVAVSMKRQGRREKEREGEKERERGIEMEGERWREKERGKELVNARPLSFKRELERAHAGPSIKLHLMIVSAWLLNLRWAGWAEAMSRKLFECSVPTSVKYARLGEHIDNYIPILRLPASPPGPMECWMGGPFCSAAQPGHQQRAVSRQRPPPHEPKPHATPPTS